MFRLSSMIFRLAMILLVAATVWIGRDPIVRSLLVRAGESAVGAKVEIGLVRTALDDDRLYVKHLAIADPRDPMRNLVQADSAWLTLDWHDLLRRRFVVEEGTACQVVFGAPRSRSGALGSAAETPPSSTVPARPQIVAHELQQDVRAAWLDQFQHATPLMHVDNSELMRESVQLFNRWKSDLNPLLARIDELRTRFEKASGLIDLNTNLLRNHDRIQRAQNQIAALQNEISAIAVELTRMDQQLIADRLTLIEAQAVDEEKLAADASRRSLNGGMITRLLLHQHQLRQAEEILAWFSDFRESVPNPTEDFSNVETIGRNVQFSKSSPPDFLIKLMQLEGEGRIGGVKFNFSGTAKNISTQPDRVTEPVAFELRAQGNTHAVVSCILDRSEGRCHDSIRIQCPDLPLPARTLGDEDSLSVSVSSCRARVDVALSCVDECISGNFSFDHTNLVMQIDYLDPRVGGSQVADQINLDLASISDYQVHATIQGPVLRPTIEFQSDLGDRLAEKFNHVVALRSRQASIQLKEMLELQLNRLNDDIGPQVRQISQVLENEHPRPGS